MRRLRGEGGFTLVELLTVTVILSVVLAGLTTLFVQGSNAELDMNSRFQAQLNARLALDKLRRDLHCASGPHYNVTPTATSVTLDDVCASGGVLTWCTSGAGSNFSLYRNLGAACSTAASARWVDRLTSGNVFWFDRGWQNSLAKVHVDLRVNSSNQPATRTVDTYELCDVIVLRNATRGAFSVTTTSGSTAVTLTTGSTGSLVVGDSISFSDGTTTTISAIGSATTITTAASTSNGGAQTMTVTSQPTTLPNTTPTC